MTAFIANTNVLDLIGLKDEIDGTFINDADVSVTIKDADGNEVTGQTWPATMTYVAASDGNYRAFVSEEVEFVHRAKHTAIIDADGGENLVGHWEFVFRPLNRTVEEETE